MFTRFKRERRTLFLDPQSSESFTGDVTQMIDLILSPSLYWVKKVKLPVKSVREVKKLLPSIFEDSLAAGEYSYFVYKSGEFYFLFAYEDKKIIDLLSRKGIHPANIASVHFAQSEFDNIQKAFCINEKQCMYLQDELLVLAPSAWISDKERLSLEDIKLSKHIVKLQQFGHIVDNATLYKVGAVLGAFALIIIVEIFIASSKKDAISVAKEDIFSNYKLQPTMLQNRSSLEKYTKIYERQKSLRESIAHFLSMHLQGKQKIALIDFKNDLLAVTISGCDKVSSERIKKELDGKKVKYTASLNGENMKLEIKL